MRTAFMRSRCRSRRGPRSCLGAGLRALMTLGAYKVRQIWCSRYFLLHSQAWAGSPFRKSIASRQYLGFWRQDLCGNQPVRRVHPTILHEIISRR